MAGITLEEVAENYCSGFDSESLKGIINNNISSEEQFHTFIKCNYR